MLRLAETRSEVGVVADQFGQPTSALDIADAVLAIARRLTSDPDPSLRGLFHLSASGETSWAGFAEEIFVNLAKTTGKIIAVKSIGTADYQSWLGKFEQRGQVEFLPDFGLDAGNRRDHDETTAPEPQPGFQGKSGARRDPR